VEQSYNRRELSPEESDNVSSQAVIPVRSSEVVLARGGTIWCEAEIYKDVTNTDKGLE
jgi:hypothetical protein